jgi:hypothetical protein
MMGNKYLDVIRRSKDYDINDINDKSTPFGRLDRLCRTSDAPIVAHSAEAEPYDKNDINDKSRPPSETDFWADGGRCCDHCGCHATPANRLWSWNWPGRPAGVWLHRACEQAWFDSAHSPNSKNGRGQ